MKLRLLLLTLLAFITALMLAFRFREPTILNKIPINSKSQQKLIKCGPDWEQLETLFDEIEIPPIAGSGNHKWRISTKSDSAQFYFNQGMNMYYSFHIIEAMASFKKAARFDPGAAMIYWAQALAYGPNINDLGYAASPEALIASRKAQELAAGGTPGEQLLIKAMLVRYSADSSDNRADLNQRYADKMKEVYETYAADADVSALYADALMLQHPWDLWNINGTPKSWTPLIRSVLEKLLAAHPNHPGANHYYIHVMEPSPYASKALPSADRLGKLTPALSHTVHMPSHIYLRTGHYNKGVEVNENAVNSYKKILPLYSPVSGNDFLYVIHNLHMQANNALMAGRATYSVQIAKETETSIPPAYLSFGGSLGNYMQYIHMTPVLADVRFGRWDELLNRRQPEASLVYANVLYRFGRGMAFASLSKIGEAQSELEQLRLLMKDSVLRLPFTPFSPAIEGSTVAEKLLAGTIALVQKKYSDAVEHLSSAVTTEEGMVYTEPRDWMLNPKHYLGKAYLLSGQFSLAEKTFARDLQYNNENVWALRGLYQALSSQRKIKAATAVAARLKKASMRADVKITEAAF